MASCAHMLYSYLHWIHHYRANCGSGPSGQFDEVPRAWNTPTYGCMIVQNNPGWRDTMRIAAILGLAGLLYHTQAVTVASQAPKNHTSETTVARLTVARANGDSFETFRRGEYRELLNKLAHQPDTTLQAISAYDSPIGI